jgi:molybdate transport system substrate-binding protein
MASVVNRYVIFVIVLAATVPNITCNAGAGKERPELVIAAAISLKDVFVDLGREFESLHNVKIIFNFAGSNSLQRQLENGAPADLFASASVAELDALVGQQLILPETRRTFAGNSVVLIGRAPPDGGDFGFDDLADQRISHIALGSGGVPVRIYCEEVLRELGLWNRLSGKYVFGNNARQVLQYVASGEAEAGLVYSTDAQSSPDVRVMQKADLSWHRPIVYPVAVVSDSHSPELAKDFIDFLLSASGRKTLLGHGFALPSEYRGP